jgi:hypothetical protein
MEMTDRETLETKLETCVGQSKLYQLIVNNRRPYALMAELLDYGFDKEDLFQPIREIGQKIYDQVGLQELKKIVFRLGDKLGPDWVDIVDEAFDCEVGVGGVELWHWRRGVDHCTISDVEYQRIGRPETDASKDDLYSYFYDELGLKDTVALQAADEFMELAKKHRFSMDEIKKFVEHLRKQSRSN